MKNLLILLLLFPIVSLGQLQKESSFENPMPGGYTGNCSASYSPWACIEGSNATYSHQISTLFKRSGNSSWRTELRPGDAAVANGSFRTEMTMIPKGSAIATGANAFGISVYIPASASAWVNLSQERIVGMQSHPWQGSTTNGSPNWAIQIKSGRWRMAIVHTGANTANNASQTFLYVDMGPVVYDVWTDWEVWTNNLKTTSGRIVANKVVNGVRTDKICNYTGYALHGFSDWPFIKMGTYDWNINNGTGGTAPRIVYYDMARYGKATEANFSAVIGLTATPPPPNQAPIVSVGANVAYPAGTTNALLDATATDPEGGNMTYNWTQTAGPTVILTGASTKNASVSGMTNNNTYSFRFTATDLQGAATSASKSLSVAAANVPPTVTIGPNQTLSQGIYSTTLTGGGNDPDGTLTGGAWTQASGPSTATIASPTDLTPTTSSTVVSGLLPGSTYTFRYEVTDNNGAKASATVTVTLPAANILPAATPAPPTINLNSVFTSPITVLGTDQDGFIASYAWIQLSGPNTATLTGTSGSTAVASNMIVGTYIFQCTVTDNSGGQAATTVQVTVNYPPTVSIDTTLQVVFVKGVTSVPLDADVNDPDGTIDSVRWMIIEYPVGATLPVIAASNSVTTTMSNLIGGHYMVQLVAYDNDGASGVGIYEFDIQPGYMIIRKGRRKDIPR